MADIERYPLSWPTGWKRTTASARVYSRWSHRRDDGYGLRDLTTGEALSRLTGELGRLGVPSRECVISTNIPTRLDGLPYASAREPDDPGVAVYFQLNGQPRCLATDRYRKVAGNLAAIAAHIEALRAIDRYGIGTLDQAFAGYVALPERASPDTWRTVLGVGDDADLLACRRAYYAQAKVLHPDAQNGETFSGEDAEAFAALTQAWDDAQAFFARATP